MTLFNFTNQIPAFELHRHSPILFYHICRDWRRGSQSIYGKRTRHNPGHQTGTAVVQAGYFYGRVNLIFRRGGGGGVYDKTYL